MNNKDLEYFFKYVKERSGNIPKKSMYNSKDLILVETKNVDNYFDLHLSIDPFYFKKKNDVLTFVSNMINNSNLKHKEVFLFLDYLILFLNDYEIDFKFRAPNNLVIANIKFGINLNNKEIYLYIKYNFKKQKPSEINILIKNDLYYLNNVKVLNLKNVLIYRFLFGYKELLRTEYKLDFLYESIEDNYLREKFKETKNLVDMVNY